MYHYLILIHCIHIRYCFQYERLICGRENNLIQWIFSDEDCKFPITLCLDFINTNLITGLR